MTDHVVRHGVANSATSGAATDATMDATQPDAVVTPSPQWLCAAADRAWTVEAIRALGMTTDIETAASILGFGRTKAYELAKTGQFPVPTLRIGRRYRVPIPAILHLLHAE
jgi:hypothetical protein